MATVILFGATGFIGRNLAPAFAQDGHTVIGVSKSGGAVDGASETFSIERLGQIDVPPQDTVVVHVAAKRYDAARFAMAQSDILSENVAMSNQIYGFSAERGIKEVRLASSSVNYPAGQDLLDDAVPIDLNRQPYPNEAFYAWSKRWGEIVADLYRERYGVNTLAFRLSNPYGPHDTLDAAAAHVLPAFVMRALSPATEFRLKGDPGVERDFVWVGDVAKVFIRSLEQHGENAAYNLCCGTTVTLHHLAELVLARAAPARPLVTESEFAPAAVRVRRPTADRAKAAFGIERFTALEHGLDQTIAWYREALPRG